MDTTKATPAEDLRAEALTRTLATIRGRFPRIADDDAEEMAAVLLRTVDGRGGVRFRRRENGGVHTAWLSLLEHPACGAALYVDRIE